MNIDDIAPIEPTAVQMPEKQEPILMPDHMVKKAAPQGVQSSTTKGKSEIIPFKNDEKQKREPITIVVNDNDSVLGALIKEYGDFKMNLSKKEKKSVVDFHKTFKLYDVNWDKKTPAFACFAYFVYVSLIYGYGVRNARIISNWFDAREMVFDRFDELPLPFKACFSHGAKALYRTNNGSMILPEQKTMDTILPAIYAACLFMDSEPVTKLQAVNVTSFHSMPEEIWKTT